MMNTHWRPARGSLVAGRSSQTASRLLGAADHLDETMRLAYELREFSVRDLVDQLDLTMAAANNRLRQLLRAQLISRARVIPKRGGNECRYTVPGVGTEPMPSASTATAGKTTAGKPRKAGKRAASPTRHR